MLRDWDVKDDDMFNERLIIPSSSYVTLSMNGHMFNRDMTEDNNSDFDGELIKVDANAALVINGGTKGDKVTVK